MTRLAIIGTGIAGLGCAHFLNRDFEITLFEHNSYVGGHSNTVAVEEPGTGRSLPVDTGFMVYNRVTYPLLTRLFGQLGVESKPTTMCRGWNIAARRSTTSSRRGETCSARGSTGC